MDAAEFIMTALTAGATSVVTEGAKDAYTKLRLLLEDKLSHTPKAQKALVNYEDDPDLYAEALKRILQQQQVDQDSEIIQAAKLVLDKVKPGQAAVGKYNVQAKTIYSVSHGDHQQVTNHFDIKPDDK